jgi:hypothetical protein
MRAPDDWVVVGIDNGGTANNATVLDSGGRFLVDDLAETASYVKEGPDKAIAALLESFTSVLALTSVPTDSVKAIGLDTPGPASADGVISSLGATNFVHPGWRGFGRAVRTPCELRRRGAAAELGVRDRRHRPGRRRGGVRPRGQRRGGHGR